MKNKFLKINLLAVLLPLYLLTSAQVSAGDTLFIQRNDKGKIEFARFTSNESSDRKMNNDTIFLKSVLKAKNEDGFRIEIETTDDQGITHRKYQQYFKGIEVDNAEYLTHGKDGVIEVINGDFQVINIETVTPAITERQALAKALVYVGAKKYKWEDEAMEKWLKQNSNEPNATYYPKGELVIAEDHLKGSASFKLSWKFIISSLDPNNEQMIFVDAVNGAIIRDIPLSRNTNTAGTAQTMYSSPPNQTITCDSQSSSFRLYESRTTITNKTATIQTKNCSNSTIYNSATDFSNTNVNWTSGNWTGFSQHQVALDVHWAAERVLDYWSSVHTRNSLDNSGLKVTCCVHYGAGQNNAAWFQVDKVIVFGDGDGLRCNPFVSLDIVAHEMGHGINQFTAKLTSGNLESGALDEGFGDIWGACVKAWAAPNKQRWLSGSEIMRNPLIFNCVRNMENPASPLSWEGAGIILHPSRYQGTNWDNTTNDPHINSTVLSHWFYLLCEGGSGTNDGITFSVNGIGINKAELIAFRALANYLYSSANYSAARNATIQAAIYLYGDNTPEVIAVTNAWHAVGVGSFYSPAISGPNLVPCTGNVIYTLPSNATNVSWSVATLDIVGSTGNSFTVKKNTGSTVQSGTVFASGTYYGHTFTVSRIVQIGVPRITSLTPSSTVNTTIGNIVYFIAYPSLNSNEGSYEWLVPSYPVASQSKWMNYNDVKFYEEGYYPVGVRTYMSTAEGHACTISPTTYTITYVNVSYYSPSPPPPPPPPPPPSQSLQSSVEVFYKDVNVWFDPGYIPTQQTVSWRLYNIRSSLLVASGKIASTGGTLNFSYLPDGLYILQIDVENGPPETHKISLQ